MAQFVQEAAAEAAYWPAAHMAHAMPVEVLVPEKQLVHAAALAAEYFPAPQAAQTVLNDAPAEP